MLNKEKYKSSLKYTMTGVYWIYEKAVSQFIVFYLCLNNNSIYNDIVLSLRLSVLSRSPAFSMYILKKFVYLLIETIVLLCVCVCVWTR